MASRCRLCTSNDEDAVIEHVAAYMGESRMERVEDRTPWAEAGATWQTAFREMAVAAQLAIIFPSQKAKKRPVLPGRGRFRGRPKGRALLTQWNKQINCY
jgi:hypothetical protein